MNAPIDNIWIVLNEWHEICHAFGASGVFFSQAEADDFADQLNKNAEEGDELYTVHCYSREKSQEWIAVEDRLPEPEQFVLVYGPGDDLEKHEVYLACLYNDGMWSGLWAPSHWMPRPQGPSD